MTRRRSRFLNTRHASSVSDEDWLETHEMRRLQMFVCLIPVAGFFPSLWILYRGQGTRHQQAVSRLAITLALGWLMGSILLNTGAQAADNLSLPLLIMSSLLTSGYFLTNIWLMVQLWRRKSIWLPGISRLGDRIP
ncbi:MAG: hypothetical protein ACFE0J_09695 [Elainellaceae cyanobacterium]